MGEKGHVGCFEHLTWFGLTIKNAEENCGSWSYKYELCGCFEFITFFNDSIRRFHRN